ncbi:unnamed protein product [Symbiodinium natans]|uniref:Uncharacterized protein n=1 Tax=Symbiodinium natans TaxID=878477 RepID=A0A812TFP5_9DINO|nr:unnamed protein product [Symbiodinium natans]
MAPLVYPSHRCRKRFLQHARTRFNSLLSRFQQALDEQLAHVACKQAHRDLSQRLTGALVDGETVTFEDEGALSAYTLKRLRPRSRALFEVLLAVDSAEVLSSLLRSCRAATQQGRELRIASLGGGPAFDLVALLATLESLCFAISQEPDVAMTGEGCDPGDLVALQCAIRCTVLDLFPSWSSAVAAVGDVSSKIWSRQSPEFLELLAPVDLRSSDCQEIIDAVCKADVVIAAYVLHENEAAILGEDGVQGAFPQIFRHLPLDVPLIFLDATHRLWPQLVASAEAVSRDSLRAIIPEGLGSHIHAALLLKGTRMPTTSTTDCRRQLDAFTAHQQANQARLKKLQGRKSASVLDIDGS